MTTAQPGQEQRMETCAECGKFPVAPNSQFCSRECFEQAVAKQSRPTADLGEDGELVRRLRGTVENWAGADIRHLLNPDGPEAADRLILYREALRRARRIIATETLLPDELAAIDAVLSRSGS